MVVMVYSGSWLSYADSPVFLSAGRLHTSRHRSVVGLQRRSAGKPALQPAWLKREFDREKKNILVRITEENAWMFPTKFWRQTDSNPHQKLWCKSALELEYYWHTYATHTHTCRLMWWEGIISSQQVSWSHSDRRCMIKPSLHELTKTTAEIKSGRGDALLWKGKDKRMDSY